MSAYSEAVEHVGRTLKPLGIAVVEGIVGERVVAYPIVLVQQYIDAIDTLGVGGSRALTTVTLTVRIVGRENEHQLRDLAQQMDELLHKSASGRVISCVRVAEMALVTLESGTSYRYQGGRYELLV